MVLAIWLAGLAILWLPGALLARWVLRVPRHNDWIVQWALELGLGMAWWPLFLLWTTILGWHWSAELGRAVVVILCAGGIAALALVPRWRWRARLRYVHRHGLWLIFFGCILGITILTRLLHVRGLALPAWVDPVHHLAIVRLLVADGALPRTLDPYIPGGVFDYHWGFHVPLAWLAWAVGRMEPLALADELLHYGQLLNALTVVMVYAAGRTLFASRRAGLWAAVLAGTVSWFPAYYVTWGRYTQLAGMLLLCVLIALLVRTQARPRWSNWAALVLLASGLALVHVRIAFFALVWVGIVAVALCFQRRWPTLLRLAGAGVAALLLTLPWWSQLLAASWVREVLTPQVITSDFWLGYNRPDLGLLWAPRQVWLMLLATAGWSGILGWAGPADPVLQARIAGAGWLLMLVGVGVLQVGRRRDSTTGATWRAWGMVVAWGGLTALVLQLDLFGLPSLRIANINAWIIALYLPLALAAGGLLAWGTGLLLPASWAIPTAGGLALAVAVASALGMRDVVNPATILATQGDRAALAWIRVNTPAAASFLSPAWRWQGSAFAGADGGSWIGVLADRASLPLPVLYSSALPSDQVQALNALLASWADAESLADPVLRQRMRAAGITHLYLGARPSNVKVEQALAAPYLRLVYREAGVAIFELLPEP